MLQEFGIEIKDKSGKENLVDDHLSRIISPEDATPIYDTFSGEHLFETKEAPWYVHIVNNMVSNQFPLESTHWKKEKLKRRQKGTYGMNDTFGNIVLIK